MPKIVDHEQRRAEVLEATWRVIARLGIAGATTREIAREAGCSTGVLAHYFSNKDEIVRLALDYAHLQVRSRITALRDRLTGVAVLRAVLAESLPLDSQRHTEMTLEIAFWARAVAQTSLRSSQHADFDRWHHLIRDLIAEAIAAGELAADLDPDETAAALVCFTDGLGTNSCLYPERLPTARVERLLDRQLTLIGATGRRRRRVGARA